MNTSMKVAAQTSRLNVRTYSDADLRDLVLEVRDPLAVEGLVFVSPPADAELTFVAQYESVQDVMCIKGHKHRRGFVLEDCEGKRYLVGRDCAKLHYGFEWDKSVRDFQAQINRQKSLQWLARVSSNILSLEAKLFEIVADPSVSAFDQLRRDAQNLPRAVFSQLRDASGRPDRTLYGTYKEMNPVETRKRKERARLRFQTAKTTREKDRAKRELMEAEKPVVDLKVIGVTQVVAPTLFLPNMRMRGRLEERARRLVRTAQALHSGHLAPTDLKAVSKSISAVANEFDSVLSEIDEAISFFSGKNLEALQQWLRAEEFCDLRVERTRDGLLIWERDLDPVSLSRPSDLRPLAINLSDLLRFH